MTTSTGVGEPKLMTWLMASAGSKEMATCVGAFLRDVRVHVVGGDQMVAQPGLQLAGQFLAQPFQDLLGAEPFSLLSEMRMTA